MNILYIGPYRQSSVSGYLSKEILLNILDTEHNVTARPIYFSKTKNIQEIHNKEIILSEKLHLNKYDILIQHTTPDSIIYNTHFKTNICIPILNNRILNEHGIERMSLCDKILVDNIYTHNHISKKLKEKIFLFDYNIYNLSDTSNLNKFNLGIFDSMQKYYTIVDYKENIDLVQDLIVSFIISSSINETVCLVLNLINSDQESLTELQNIIKLTYEKLKLNNTFNKILLVPLQNNISNILSAHNTGDIFLNINEDDISSIYDKYALYFKNKFINHSNIDFEKRYTRNNIINNNGYLAVLQDSIKNIFMNDINNQQNDITKPYIVSYI